MNLAIGYTHRGDVPVRGIHVEFAGICTRTDLRPHHVHSHDDTFRYSGYLSLCVSLLRRQIVVRGSTYWNRRSWSRSTMGSSPV